MSKHHQVLLSSGKTYPYEVINSKRAKYIRIKLSDSGKLSVVLPSRILVNDAHEFVKSKADWIEKNLVNIITTSQRRLPDIIKLPVLNETWTIDYVPFSIDEVELIELAHEHFEIRGNIEDKQLIKKVINKWCQRKAKTVFTSMLNELAEEHGFHYRRLSIRSQKTRWGSCSNNKNINLNSKLLLMPESTVRYVMIHELCHTIEMNHSSQFWRLVEDCDPNFKVNRKELKLLGKMILL